MTTKQRLVKIEKLCATHEKGTDAAIERLQSVVRELIEICKTQQEEISSLWAKQQY